MLIECEDKILLNPSCIGQLSESIYSRIIGFTELELV